MPCSPVLQRPSRSLFHRRVALRLRGSPYDPQTKSQLRTARVPGLSHCRFELPPPKGDTKQKKTKAKAKEQMRPERRRGAQLSAMVRAAGEENAATLTAPGLRTPGRLGTPDALTPAGPAGGNPPGSPRQEAEGPAAPIPARPLPNFRAPLRARPAPRRAPPGSHRPARPAAGSLPPGRKPEPAGGGGRSYLEAPVPWAGTG